MQALAVGLGTDKACIDSKAVTVDQPLRHAALHSGFGQLAQEIAVTDTAVAVLQKGGVVGHVALQPKPAKPTVCEIEMHLVAQSPLGADAKAVADQQHADHQLRINRWASRLAVEGPQLLPDQAQISETVDRWKDMVG